MGEFLRELRRRNVVRAGLAYVLGSWALLQVLDMLGNVVGYPDWVWRLVLLLLILGLPLVLVASWIYDVSPQGIRRESEIAPETPRVAWRFNMVIACLLLVAAGLTGTAWYLRSGPDVAAGGQLEKSIAVLPFAAFSSEAAEQHFANGLADTVLDKLAQLKDLKVIARTSSFQYQSGVDVREVGRELAVATVLEGSVQRSGEKLRVIAQLIDTSDGSHLWSRTFDTTNDDVFGVQDAIANAVVDEMRVSVSAEEADRLDAHGTTSAAAYALVTSVREQQDAVSVFGSSLSELISKAAAWNALLDEALELDPGYAGVYRTRAGIFDILAFRSPEGSEEFERFVEAGRRAALQAINVDPDDPRGFADYGSMLRRSGDLDGAEVFLRYALRSLPNDAETRSALVLTLSGLGRNADEQRELIEKVVAVEPNSTFAQRQLGFVYLNLGRIEEAAELVESKLETSNEVPILAQDIVFARSALLGEHRAAAQALARAGTLTPRNDMLDLNWALLLRNVGAFADAERLLRGVDDSGQIEALRASLLIGAGDFDKARSLLAGAGAGSSDVAWETGNLCFVTGDFECAVAGYLEAMPQLDPQRMRPGGLRNSGEFRTALDLTVAYRALGRSDLAAVMLQPIDEYVARQKPGSASLVRDYNLPVYEMLRGNTDGALTLIRERIERPDGAFVPTLRRFDSEAFSPLAGNAEFAALVQKFETRREAARREVLALSAS